MTSADDDLRQLSQWLKDVGYEIPEKEILRINTGQVGEALQWLAEHAVGRQKAALIRKDLRDLRLESSSKLSQPTREKLGFLSNERALKDVVRGRDSLDATASELESDLSMERALDAEHSRLIELVVAKKLQLDHIKRAIDANRLQVHSLDSLADMVRQRNTGTLDQHASLSQCLELETALLASTLKFGQEKPDTGRASAGSKEKGYVLPVDTWKDLVHSFTTPELTTEPPSARRRTKQNLPPVDTLAHCIANLRSEVLDAPQPDHRQSRSTEGSALIGACLERCGGDADKAELLGRLILSKARQHKIQYHLDNSVGQRASSTVIPPSFDQRRASLHKEESLRMSQTVLNVRQEIRAELRSLSEQISPIPVHTMHTTLESTGRALGALTNELKESTLLHPPFSRPPPQEVSVVHDDRLSTTRVSRDVWKGLTLHELKREVSKVVHASPVPESDVQEACIAIDDALSTASSLSSQMQAHLEECPTTEEARKLVQLRTHLLASKYLRGHRYADRSNQASTKVSSQRASRGHPSRSTEASTQTKNKANA